MRRFTLTKSCLYGSAGLLFTLCLLIFAGGCVKLDRPSLDRKYFTIDVKRDDSPASQAKSAKTLIIRRVKISPRYEDRDLVYKIGPNAYEADYYNSFFIPPAALMTQELRLWMSDSGLFANVLGPESMVTGELLLEGIVNSIYGDYSQPQPKAVLNMQFFLLDNNKAAIPIIYSRNFSREIPMKGNSADELIDAMNQGIKEIFEELEKDLAGLVG
ncbi:ABC-type transport auxiliary lipoprotein family protein [Maridesulfovibrio sp. FT414]|uniref:ABC-type transport auxiliary lipoprotein family protein n=1 Tax=Maridesulfovibrio sp. FT414 TaxID=2979469 RepID=UPI003D803B15